MPAQLRSLRDVAYYAVDRLAVDYVCLAAGDASSGGRDREEEEEEVQGESGEGEHRDEGAV